MYNKKLSFIKLMPFIFYIYNFLTTIKKIPYILMSNNLIIFILLNHNLKMNWFNETSICFTNSKCKYVDFVYIFIHYVNIFIAIKTIWFQVFNQAKLELNIKLKIMKGIYILFSQDIITTFRINIK